MPGPQEPPSAAGPRVLHLVSSLEIGGKERVVLELAGEARKRGREHALLLFDAPHRADGRDLDPGAIPWEFTPRGPGLDLRFVREVARRAARFEVVHAHNDTAIFYAAAAATLVPPWRRRPGLVGTFHTLPGHDTPWARRLTRWATRRCRAITAVSDELAQRLVKLGWSRPCRVIWNGAPPGQEIDPSARSRWRARLGVGPNELLVGQVARFDPVKRQEDLITAIGLARAKGMAVQAVFAGEGPTLPPLRASAADSPWLHFLGNSHDVPGLLAALDVFVLCSDHEAAPRALLEALAAGCPAVVTEVGGMPHVVGAGTGESAALLVPPRSPQALAAALHELEDPNVRAPYVARAKRRAEAFSSRTVWEAYAALWRDSSAGLE